MSGIAEIIVWSNGMVMTFDDLGQQMPDYQGRASDVLEKALAAADEGTTLSTSDWGSGWTKRVGSGALRRYASRVESA